MFNRNSIRFNLSVYTFTRDEASFFYFARMFGDRPLTKVFNLVYVLKTSCIEIKAMSNRVGFLTVPREDTLKHLLPNAELYCHDLI